MMSGWGFSESPLVDGEMLICTPGGTRLRWPRWIRKPESVWTTAMPYGGSHGGDGAGYSSIVISQGAGVKQYVQLVGRGDRRGSGQRQVSVVIQPDRQRHRQHSDAHRQRRLRFLHHRLRHRQPALLKIREPDADVKAEESISWMPRSCRTITAAWSCWAATSTGARAQPRLPAVCRVEDRQDRLDATSGCRRRFGRGAVCRRQSVLPL